MSSGKDNIEKGVSRPARDMLSLCGLDAGRGSHAFVPFLLSLHMQTLSFEIDLNEGSSLHSFIVEVLWEQSDGFLQSNN
jgi:hypothetical protein